MQTATVCNLYKILDLREFATSSEIAKRINELDDCQKENCKLAIEILSDPDLKSTFDGIWEAWNRTDRILPRFAKSEDAILAIDVAQRVGFKLNEVFDNTFEVSMAVQDSVVVEAQEPVFDSARLEIGMAEYRLIACQFVARIHPYSQRVFLTVENQSYIGVANLKDPAIQKQTKQDDEGLLFYVNNCTSSQQFAAAIFNQSQRFCEPLSEAGKHLFHKSGNEIAASFQIRNSTNRIKQLIRKYYVDVAQSLVEIEARIPEKPTLKSFKQYAERHFG